MEEILKLLYDSACNGNLIFSMEQSKKDIGFNKELFDSILYNCLNFYEAYDSIKKINTFSKKSEMLRFLWMKPKASFDSNNYIISFYLLTLYQFILKLSIKSKEMFDNDFELNLYINLLFTLIVIHELEHWKQSEKSVHPHRSFESLFWYLGSASENSSNIINYAVSYKYNPLERAAFIRMHEFAIEMLKPINNKVPNLIKIERNKLLKARINGYCNILNINSPTKIFYQYARELYLYERILSESEKESLSLNDRLYFGLPITDSEYNETKDKIVLR